MSAAIGLEAPPTPAAPSQPLLVVEDDAPLRQMLSWELAELGYDIGAAGGCTEAHRLVDRRPFRFALVDVRLPDGDGRDLAAQLTDRLPGLGIVLMSGDHWTRATALPEAGVLAFVAKPVDLSIMHLLFSAAARLPCAGVSEQSPSTG